MSSEIARVQRLLAASGLKYHMHSAGTTLEGSWSDCMRVIGQCHTLVHTNGVVRIQSDIRIGTRTDKVQGFEDKVKSVERLLAEEGGKAEKGEKGEGEEGRD